MRQVFAAAAMLLALGACSGECMWAQPIKTNDGFELLQLSLETSASLRNKITRHNQNYARFCLP